MASRDAAFSCCVVFFQFVLTVRVMLLSLSDSVPLLFLVAYYAARYVCRARIGAHFSAAATRQQGTRTRRRASTSPSRSPARSPARSRLGLVESPHTRSVSRRARVEAGRGHSHYAVRDEGDESGVTTTPTTVVGRSRAATPRRVGAGDRPGCSD